MSQLSAAHVERAFCKLIGLSHFAYKDCGAFSEISCVYNLDLMEKFNDFNYITADMFHAALTSEDASSIPYSIPKLPQPPIQECISTPLDPYGKICLEKALSGYVQDYYHRFGFKTNLVMPNIISYIEEERKKKSSKDLINPKSDKDSHDAESQDSLDTKENVESTENTSTDSVSKEEDKQDKELSQEEKDAAEAQKLLDFVSNTHRYTDRKINIRFIKGWDNNCSSLLWSFALLKNQLTIVDDGITDMLRDVIVYEWFDKQSDEFKAQYPNVDLDVFYKALELTDVIMLPDGKSILWYSLKEPLLGESIQGFGIDIDPPYKHNYAVGIKHVYFGSLDQHPTLQIYKKLLSNDSLRQVVRSAHFCPADNISPFSSVETSDEMTFINDAYIIVNLVVGVSNKQEQSMEIMVKYHDNLDVDLLSSRLSKLKKDFFNDFQSLVSEVVEGISGPLVDMKNEQELKRRNKDAEYASYIFKDALHRQEFTYKHLMRHYPLALERILLEEDNSLKLILPSNLFAFIDKDDDQYQENGVLGMIHADAIVVTLKANIVSDQDGEHTSYDLASIDLADCVQIPFGMHQNQDVKDFIDQSLDLAVSDLNTPLYDGWEQDWEQDIAVFKEVQDKLTKDKEEKIQAEKDRVAAIKAKSQATRKRLREERKKKKKK